jgi:putative ABC transport system substrate-binding protein
MQRREFIKLLGGAAAVWPLSARAQQPDRMRRIAVLVGYAEDDPETKARLAAFRQGLERRRWSEGRNVRIDCRFAAGRTEQFQPLAKELVALQPDVILAHTTPVVAALQQESPAIPIVFVNVSDPIGSRFIASLSRPGGNLTGVLHYEASITGKWLAMLKEIAPRTGRAALLANPKTTPYDYFLQAAMALAPSLAMELVPSPVDDAADIERAIVAFARVPDVGLILPPDSTTILHRDLIIELAARHACRLSTPPISLSRPGVLCPTEPIRSTCFGRRQPMSTASCAATSRLTFRCRPRPGMKRPSISKPRRSLIWRCRPACW